MTDLVKGVLGSPRSLIIGWILPTFVTVQLIAALIVPAMRGLMAFSDFLRLPNSSRQLALLAVSVIGGLIVAAAQTPLYRILEGYLLWPTRIADWRIGKHQERRRNRREAQAAAEALGQGVRSGLLYEQADRYPVQDRQFAPTTLGNAIRRFETYAGDRYLLDSQLLWHHLTASVPERTVAAVDKARTNVDFFVCLSYGGAVTAATAVIVAGSGHANTRTWMGLVLGAFISVSCYRLAVLATDEWNQAVRALVDLGRAGVAAAFGLNIPDDFNSERHMWRTINTLVRRPYAYSESKDIAAIISQFRIHNACERSAPTAPSSSVDNGLVSSSVPINKDE